MLLFNKHITHGLDTEAGLKSLMNLTRVPILLLTQQDSQQNMDSRPWEGTGAERLASLVILGVR